MDIYKEIGIAVIVSLILIAILYFVLPYVPLKDASTVVKEKAISECVNLCNKYKGKIIYENGPCLSDLFEYNVKDWVCDIAHKPRQDVDNIPENQCKAFREGKAKHFVEVDENCNVIRTY